MVRGDSNFFLEQIDKILITKLHIIVTWKLFYIIVKNLFHLLKTVEF